MVDTKKNILINKTYKWYGNYLSSYKINPDKIELNQNPNLPYIKIKAVVFRIHTIIIGNKVKDKAEKKRRWRQESQNKGRMEL